MSYRSFKRTLGETNLERKCRWLFGLCLMVLISASFWWYSRQSDDLLFRWIGEELVNRALFELHFEEQEQDPLLEAELEKVDQRISKMLRRREYRYETLLPENEQGLKKPTDMLEWELMNKWTKLGEQLENGEEIDSLDPERTNHYRMVDKQVLESNFGRDGEEIESLRDVSYYQYYEPVFAKQGCIECHNKPLSTVARPDLREGDLLAVMRVEIEADEITASQNWNRAQLITAAIITMILAMVASWAIVRYIIVKPLRHLRDVSNAIRHGEVEQRAVIHTGDEFEELGAAFNRMLRQLLRQQDELRLVNHELDGKIDEMAHANMRLFEMNQLKSDFLATVSHELRTPLNSIIGFSDLLEGSDGIDDKQRRYAHNIQRSGKQLLEMINDILDLAKIESGKLEVHPSDFQIGNVVATQCDLAQPLAQQKNIDLDYEIAPGLTPIRLDQGKVVQILNNLLSNAIKFTPDGGRINVTVMRDEQGDLRLTVADTGVGISPSEQQQVFEKFRQGTTVLPGGDAMTREYSGTGLGLSIVRELCRLMGGDVTLQSELGKGSEFTVLLPWKLDETPKLESPLSEELKLMTKPPVELSMVPPSSEAPAE